MDQKDRHTPQNLPLPSSSEMIALCERSELKGPHRGTNVLPNQGLLELVLELHHCNVQLWTLEDQVRDTYSEHDIARLKKLIDPTNIRRHEVVERIDEFVLQHFSPIDCTNAELHSETAGMMIDRLSIIILKISCSTRLDDDRRTALLCEQRDDLSYCLDRLLRDLSDGRRYYKMYRQFKMYGPQYR